ncbi:hypothetical protein D9757_000687 [Collybiopsis confluens]|uniref:Uncharacterized protein n=1 Tax=Collybiopsis confluens TaxID=2823264 RepID=A0A8H5I1D3_9AGAR|nr:hypothetical protein D9757_000687 [Collybiopsis confluens]
MASLHRLEYSKSTRARCRGGSICNGASMAPGSLRYGKITRDVTTKSEQVEWRHWGCVTPQILAELAAVIDGVPGFKKLTLADYFASLNAYSNILLLRLSDQQKIRVALASRRVNPSDIPPSARPEAGPAIATSASTSTAVNPTKRKRASVTQVSILTAGPSGQTAEEDSEEEDAPDELIVSLNTQVVGIQYYKGLVGAGEEVILHREPQNSYDRNAIRVDNIGKSYMIARSGVRTALTVLVCKGHTQVGHIPRPVALKLAPLLDSGAVTVEGVMRNGNISGSRAYTLEIIIKIFGPSDKVGALQPRLVWATPGQRGFNNGATNVAVSSNRGPRPGTRAMPSYSPPAIAPAIAPVRGGNRVATHALTLAQLEQAKKQQESLNRAAELREVMNSFERVSDEGRRSSLLDAICSSEDILKLPVFSIPPGITTNELTSQALKWCMDREYPELPKNENDKPVQFWQFHKNGNQSYYLNLATKTPQAAPPVLGRGGLVGDAMVRVLAYHLIWHHPSVHLQGLGKTLTMIALTIATKKDIPKDFSNTTLVVVPLSVLSNWEKQIQDHCKPGTLKYCTYYGSSRTQLGPQELAGYDIVFTTYQTIATEHESTRDQPARKKKKIEHALFDVKWKRVVLDEAHQIRNPKTKMSQACCGLQTQRRWAITGTPIVRTSIYFQNPLLITARRSMVPEYNLHLIFRGTTDCCHKDLGSLLKFLQVCRPLDDEDFFKRLLLRPLKNGMISGAELLKALMAQVCLRRTKEMQDSAGNPLIPLPTLEMIKIPVALSNEARALYDEVERLSSERFQRLMNESTHTVIQSNALSMLTRMRQLALHPALIPRDYLEQLKQNDNIAQPNHITVTSEIKQKLQAKLAEAIEESVDIFSVSLGKSLATAVSIHTHWIFSSIKAAIERDPKCPMDRRSLSFQDLYDPFPPMDMTQPSFRSQAEEIEEGIRNAPSAKIEQLIQLLKLTPSGEKSLVFSQFTGFLDKVWFSPLRRSALSSLFSPQIGEALSEQGIPFIRFDGRMSAKRRQDAIARFSVPLQPDTSVSEFPAAGAAPSRSQRAARNRSHDVQDDDDDGDFAMPSSDYSDFEEGVAVATKSKGKGKAKKVQPDSELEEEFSSGSIHDPNNPVVMLISLKAGALGLNLVVANNVYLMDPWWQEGIESQAVDRVNRIGQKKRVHVYQLISENTVESKVLDIQDRKKKLIKEAFSGVKRTETERQHREARMQGQATLCYT